MESNSKHYARHTTPTRPRLLLVLHETTHLHQRLCEARVQPVGEVVVVQVLALAELATHLPAEALLQVRLFRGNSVLSSDDEHRDTNSLFHAVGETGTRLGVLVHWDNNGGGVPIRDIVNQSRIEVIRSRIRIGRNCVQNRNDRAVQRRYDETPAKCLRVGQMSMSARKKCVVVTGAIAIP